MVTVFSKKKKSIKKKEYNHFPDESTTKVALLIQNTNNSTCSRETIPLRDLVSFVPITNILDKIKWLTVIITRDIQCQKINH